MSSIAEPIAVIGLSCSFAGDIHRPESLWKVMDESLDVGSEIPSSRFHLDSFEKIFHHKNKFIRRGYFLNEKEINEFDAAYFGLSDREAMTIDPSHRLLLKKFVHLIEDANYPLDQIKGTRTSVFIGQFTTEHLVTFYRSKIEEQENFIGPNLSLYNASARLAYHFNLQGPNLTLDSACSSSLQALQLAVQSLRTDQADWAVAGGTNLNYTPETFFISSTIGAISPDGRSRVFSSDANGYAKGEGVGLVLLKRLNDAIRDGDDIYCVIRDVMVTHDGNEGKLGYNVPSTEGQLRLLKNIYEKNRIDPKEIFYVEAHGTGTQVGDPIEANALGQFFHRTFYDPPLLIGSIKSIIGHTEATAGIASLIRVALSMKHRRLTSNMHFTRLNPSIKAKEYHLHIVRNRIDFPDHSVMIGINSFGIGGNTAHAIVSEWSTEDSDEFSSISSTWSIPSLEEEKLSQHYLLTFSAKTDVSLRKQIEQFAEWLSTIDQDFLNENEDLFLSSLSDKLLLRRTSNYSSRLAFVCSTIDELKNQIQCYLSEGSNRCSGLIRPSNSSIIPSNTSSLNICFIYSGQGPQWWAMGRELFHREAIFRYWMEKLHQEFLSVSEGKFSLIEQLFQTTNEDESQINDTNVAQPAILAIQIGLTALWFSWNIRPKYVVGHSVGEIAAAFVAGRISMHEAAKIIYHRSRLQNLNTNQGGKMLALFLSEAETKKSLVQYQNLIDIAAMNSPKSVTLSGDDKALEEFEKRIKTDYPNVYCSRLRINNAFHSYQMERFNIHSQLIESLGPINDEELKEFLDIQCPSSDLYSTVTGGKSDRSDLNGEYWWKNIRYPVLFYQTIDALLPEMTKSNGIPIFVEISPHPVLSMTIDETFLSFREKRHLSAEENPLVLCSLKRKTPEQQTLISSFAQLYSNFGSSLIDLKKFFSTRISTDLKDRTVRSLMKTMPLYCFNEEIHWYEDADSVLMRRAVRNADHPLLGYRLWSNESHCPTWKKVFRFDRNSSHLSYLFDHQVQGNVLFPASGYLELVLAALNQLFRYFSFEQSSIQFEQIQFLHGLSLRENQQIHLETVIVHPLKEFFIYSRSKTSNDPRRVKGMSGEDLLTDFTDENALHSFSSREWTLHCRGLIHLQSDSTIFHSIENCPSILDRMMRKEHLLIESEEQIEHFYRYCSLSGLHYGKEFQSICKLYRRNNELLTEHRIPSEWNDPHSDLYHFHPAILDGCFQGMIPLIPGQFHQTGLPVGIDRLIIFNRKTQLLPLMKQSNQQFYTHHSLKPSIKGISTDEIYTEDFIFFQTDRNSDHSQPLMIFQGFKIQVIDDRLRKTDLFQRLEESTSVLNRNPQKKVSTNEFIEQLCASKTWVPAPHISTSSSSNFWIILSDEKENIAEEIVQHLKSSLIHDEDQIQMISLGSKRQSNRIDLENPSELERILPSLLPSDCSNVKILYCWSFDLPSLESLDQDESLGCLALMSLLQSIYQRQCQINPRLYILTRNGQRMNEFQLNQSSLIGFARSLLNEYSPHRMKLIDLQFSSKISSKLCQSLIEEIRSEDENETDFDEEIVLSENDRSGMIERFLPEYEMIPSMEKVFAGKSEKTIVPRDQSDANPFYLHLPSPRSIENLQWNAIYPSPHEQILDDHQVEITIESVGLTYRDMLKTRGLHPYLHEIDASNDEDENIGLDFSGFIRRKGSKVRWNINDRVFGMITDGGALKSHLIIDENHCSSAPKHLSPQYLATLATYVPVIYALRDTVHLERGQTILIHAAASAVGIGLIQYSQMIGAEIFVTAGTEEKRKFLRENFGLKHVFNSRDLSFVNEIRRHAPNGTVQVIVNSLSGDFLSESLKLLSPMGHFIEIGKRDIYQNSKLSLFSLRSNCTFHVVDLVTVQKYFPEKIRNILETIGQLCDEGKLNGIGPIRSYPAAHITKAFQDYSLAQHYGKILVEIATSDQPLIVHSTLKKRTMFPDLVSQHGTIVIGGGLSGLALEMSKWMIEVHRVKRIVLLTRRNLDQLDRNSSEYHQWIEVERTAKKFNAIVELTQTDLTDSEQVFRSLSLIHSNKDYPIRGLIHSAMVLKDSLVKNMTETMLIDAMKVKVRGAWNLHWVSEKLSLPLHFFLMFSSIRNHLADTGQSNYNAGNHFLDSLAHWRSNHLHLPALSIGLPAIEDVGYLQKFGGKVKKMMKDQGIFLMPVKPTLEMIEHLFEIQQEQVIPHLSSPVMFTIDWNRFSIENLPKRIVQIGEKYRAKFGIESESKKMKDEQEKLILNSDHLIRELRSGVAKLFGSSNIDRIDLHRGLNEQGIDSLIAVELRSWLNKEFFVDIPLVELLQGMSIIRLGTIIQTKYSQQQENQSKEIRPVNSIEEETPDPSSFNPSREIFVEENSHLITLVESKSTLKLFCVPDIIGRPESYLRFAVEMTKTFGDQVPSIFAFRAKGFQSNEQSYRPLETIAEEFIAQMKQIQPYGPYHFIGYSFGGLLTYEILRQLIEDHSSTVQTVILIDPLSPAEQSPHIDQQINEDLLWKYQTSIFMHQYLTNPEQFNQTQHYLVDSSTLTDEQMQQTIHSKMKDIFPLLKKRFPSLFIASTSSNENEEDTFSHRLFNVIQNHTRASKYYTLDQAMNRRTDFSSIHPLMFTLTNHPINEKKHQIWKELFPRLTIEQVDGTHQTMLESPTLQQIIHQIKCVRFFLN